MGQAEQDEYEKQRCAWIETQTWLLSWLENEDNHCDIEKLPLGLYKCKLYNVSNARAGILVVGWGNKDDRAVRQAAGRLPPDQRPHFTEQST